MLSRLSGCVDAQALNWQCFVKYERVTKSMNDDGVSTMRILALEDAIRLQHTKHIDVMKRKRLKIKWKS